MHFTLPLLALLCVFQAVVALPTRSSGLDTAAVLSPRAAGTEQVIGSGTVKQKAIQEKCFGVVPSVFPGGFPFTQNYYNDLMFQNGFGNLCTGYFGNNFQWGTCGFYGGCVGAHSAFYGTYLPRLYGLNSIYTLNDQALKSDTNAV